jgi:8-oxo-dGTP diphosphatase
MKQVSRLGTYGILIHEGKILLTRKTKGPYEGLWDLPGGGIEFGEAPEEALKRELLEEVALSIHQFEFSTVASAICNYEKEGEPYAFHHIGLIYKVLTWSKRPDLTAEDEHRWATISHLKLEELTPFVKLSLSKNK